MLKACYEMFPAIAHSVFEDQIKLEPISFYGCPELTNTSPASDSLVEECEVVPDLSNDVLRKTCRSKRQQCTVCGKVLSSTSSYYVHMKLHSGNKPYRCTQCEASFCRKPYLEVHMRTHTGERPFECDLCLKRFTQKSSLNTHRRVHTGERPYTCDLCPKQFAVKSYLTAHRWCHVADRPLTCARCGEGFTSKAQFSAHMLTHTKKSHQCPMCGKKFVRDSFLIRHQNRAHAQSRTTAAIGNEDAGDVG